MNLRLLLRKLGAHPPDKPKREGVSSKPPAMWVHALVRVLIGLALVFVLWRLFPRVEGYEFSDLRVGMVSKRQINAPFDFWVRKNDRELALEREGARRKTPPVLRLHPGLDQVKQDGMAAFFEQAAQIAQSASPLSARVDSLMRRNPWLSQDVAGYLVSLYEGGKPPRNAQAAALQKTCVNVLRNAYTQGGGVLEDRSPLAGGAALYGALIEGPSEREIPIGVIRDLREVKKEMVREIQQTTRDEKLVRACSMIVAVFLKPTLTFDAAETQRRRDAAEAAVTVNRTMLLADLKIIGANEIVTSEHIDILNSLAAEKTKENTWQRHMMHVGQIAIVCALIAFLAAYLRIFRPAVYARNGYLALLGVLILLPVAIASAIVSYTSSLAEFSAFVLPIALSAMLVTILFDGELGLMATLVIAFLWGSIRSYDFQSTLVSLLCGGLGVHLVRQVRHRYQFYQPMIYIPLAYVATIWMANLLHFTSAQEVWHQIPAGVLNGFFSTILVIGFLPIFESLFDIPTDITLLELSDFNRPLLRDLAMATPGTYQHSIIVGNLAGAAAEAIGANSLLARVGSYYHDIGKVDKGEYFSENQMGMENPHDKLTPNLSRVVLASHVKDGVDMAQRYGLPKALRDIIQQHHGTSVMAAFYHRAVQQAEDREDVQEEEFRYSGPKPQTKEAGIVMLADAVESAVRSLEDPTPNQLRGLVQNVVASKLSDLQLGTCDLTMGDLTKLEAAFLPILAGVLHGRIKYPWQRQRRTKATR